MGLDEFPLAGGGGGLSGISPSIKSLRVHFHVFPGNVRSIRN